jgi:hypothetical protein
VSIKCKKFKEFEFFFFKPGILRRHQRIGGNLEAVLPASNRFLIEGHLAKGDVLIYDVARVCKDLVLRILRDSNTTDERKDSPGIISDWWTC